MLVFPNSKINLGLRVLDKREDGYHNIESIFYPFPYCDALEVVENDLSNDRFFYSGRPIPGDSKDNLISKAIAALRQDYEIPFLDVHLHKNVAMGAGLGGGSADGTYMLKLISEKFNLALSHDSLESLALSLGSDCPFFVANRPVLVTGRGEIMKPIDLNLSGKWLVLVTSEIHISTGAAYSNIVRNPFKRDLEGIIEAPLDEWKQDMKNDFEGYAFQQFPALGSIKQALYDAGASYASMTGSGSAMFGIFEQEPDSAQIEIPQKGELQIFKL